MRTSNALKLASWNIMINRQNPDNFSNIVTKMRELEADFLGIQEMTPDLHRYITNRTNYQFICGVETHCGVAGCFVKPDIMKCIEYFGDFNESIKYKEENILLFKTKIPIIGIQLRIDNNEYAYIASMHLPSRKTDKLKQLRNENITNFISNIEKTSQSKLNSIILLGDTNMDQSESFDVCLQNKLNDAYIMSNNKHINQYTWQHCDNIESKMRYDAFLYCNCTQTDYYVHNIDQTLSDHAPIVATFDFTQTKIQIE